VLVFIGSLAPSSIGCGGVSNAPRPDASADASIDAPSDAAVATPRCDPTKQFGTPSLVPNVNSSAREQGAVLVDDLTIYFSSDRPGGAGGSDLYQAIRSSPTSPFASPVSLGAINGPGSESGPTLTGDGLTMYYILTPGGQTTSDIHVTTRANKNAAFPAGTAVAQINSSVEDVDPFITGDGAALYFDSPRPGGTGFLDLYVSVRRSDGSFDTPQLLTSLNTATTDGHPVLRQDGLRIYWSSTRTDGGAKGGTDIWSATRPSLAGTFGTPALVPELSSPDNESPSWLAPDGCTIYLQSDRPGGMGAQDIYEAVKPM
jgi:hypothetical protein